MTKPIEIGRRLVDRAIGLARPTDTVGEIDIIERQKIIEPTEMTAWPISELMFV